MCPLQPSTEQTSRTLTWRPSWTPSWTVCSVSSSHWVSLSCSSATWWDSTETEESKQQITCLQADLKLSNLPSNVKATSFLFLSLCFSLCPLGGSVSFQSEWQRTKSIFQLGQPDFSYLIFLQTWWWCCCFCCWLGAVPIIRCPRGNAAEMVAVVSSDENWDLNFLVQHNVINLIHLCVVEVG